MHVTVRTNFGLFTATLSSFERDQLPFAASLALNDTARKVRDEITHRLPAIFSAKNAPPTPFTLRAIGTTPARKRNLQAEIFVKRIQSRYLGIEEFGGLRYREPGEPILTPTRDVERNVYGNIPRGLVHKLLAEPETYFLGTVRGVYGLWERTGQGRSGHLLRYGRGVRLLIAFRERARYRPRFGFGRLVVERGREHFGPALAVGLARAIATSIRR